MNRDEVIARLVKARPLWEPFGVAAIYLFGSAARNEVVERSDVDLLVDFIRPVSLFDFLRLRRVLGDIVGRPVDLVTRAALKPQLRDRILAEAIRAA